LELERSGEVFVKQNARYFQVQNPVLRTEMRLEVSKAWKSSNNAKRQSSGGDSNSSLVGANSSNVEDSMVGTGTSEIGGVVAMFFEGTTKPKE